MIAALIARAVKDDNLLVLPYHNKKENKNGAVLIVYDEKDNVYPLAVLCDHDNPLLFEEMDLGLETTDMPNFNITYEKKLTFCQRVKSWFQSS